MTVNMCSNLWNNEEGLLDDSEPDDDWFQVLESPLPGIKPQPSAVKIEKSENVVADDHSRSVIHLDVDCFYAQVEELKNPLKLQGKPIGVYQKNLMITCNYTARQMGVSKHMWLNEAKNKFPNLILINGEDLTTYRTVSYKITELLKQWSPLVERLGFDENFVDVSHLLNESPECNFSPDLGVEGHIYGEVVNSADRCQCGCWRRLSKASHIAGQLRNALKTQLRITTCAGIAHNKVLAKLAGSTHKPNQQTTIFPGQALQLISSLSGLSKIPGIGRATANHLQQLGIRSVSELQACDLSTLQREFDHQTARKLKQLSLGLDLSPVVASGRPQTMSEEDAFQKCTNLPDAKKCIDQLLDELLPRVLLDGRYPQTLRVTVRRNTAGYVRESRQCPIPAHIFKGFHQGETDNSKIKLLDMASTLLGRLVNINNFHLKLISVGFAKFVEKKEGSIGNYLVSTVTKPMETADSAQQKHMTVKKAETRLQEEADYLHAGVQRSSAQTADNSVQKRRLASIGETNKRFHADIPEKLIGHSQQRESAIPKQMSSTVKPMSFPFGMIFATSTVHPQNEGAGIKMCSAKTDADYLHSDSKLPKNGASSLQTDTHQLNTDFASVNTKECGSSTCLKTDSSNLFCLNPDSHCLKPDSHCLNPNSHCLKPDSHCLKQDSHCLNPDSHCLTPDSHCLKQDSHCLNPNSHCLKPDSHCLKQDSHCLNPDSHCLKRDSHLKPDSHCLKHDSHCLNPDLYSVKAQDSGLKTERIKVDMKWPDHSTPKPSKPLQVDIPGDVDETVFLELPADVKRELLRDWQLKKEFQQMRDKKKSPSKQTTGRRTSGIKQYFRS